MPDTAAHAARVDVATAAMAARETLDAIASAPGRVAVVGSLNADLTVVTERLPAPGETVPGEPLAVRAGGKSANQAVAAALAGAETSMVGAVGDDANGVMLLHSLAAAGVNAAGVRTAPVATGTAVITVDGHGENTIVVSPGANGELSVSDVVAHRELLEAAAVLGLCLEVGDGALLAAQEIVAGAAVARDADTGGKSVLNTSPLRPHADELRSNADVLIVNEHELAAIVNADFSGRETSSELVDLSPEGIARAVVGVGIHRAVVTLGPTGAVVVDNGQVTAVPAFPVQVVDTTGAGDAFMGSLMAAMASGVGLAEGAALASAFAAIATTRPGAQASYPGADQLGEFLSSW